MNKVFPWLVMAVIMSLVGVIGDYFVKLAGVGPKYVYMRWLLIGFLIYGCTAFGWFFIMKHVKLPTLGVYYAVSTVLFLAIVSRYYFKEQMNAYEIAGVILGITSLVLLAKFA